MGLQVEGVSIVTAQAAYVIDNEKSVAFSMGHSSRLNLSGMLLFESRLLPYGLHHLNITYYGNSSMSPLAITYFIRNPSSLPGSSSSTTIHRKPINGGVIVGLILISLLLNIWPTHML